MSWWFRIVLCSLLGDGGIDPVALSERGEGKGEEGEGRL